MLQLPNRKFNRLKGYDYSNPGMYFVTVCTHNRQKLFEPETVGNDLCVVPCPQNKCIHKWLAEAENKFDNVRIDKYVIMPNHLHVIIEITERHTGRSLQNIVQWFKTMSTNEYISMVKDGICKPFNKKMWQKSYYDHIIRNECDYIEIWKYIDENPLGLKIK